ncbi:MAG: DUF3822 family protein [Bacteroidales bacterium]|nr:DUF3822 family protein [Bacteroidales bacterium]
MAGNLNAIHSFSDPGLDKQKIFEYELSVRLKADSLAYCILDTNTNKFLHLEAWDLAIPDRKPFIPGDKEPTDTRRLVQLLEDELNWLTHGFSRIRIVIDQGKSTLMPRALFRAEERKNIYELNVAGGPWPEKELRYDELSSVNAFAVYHLPADMGEMIGKYFSSAGIYHYSSAFIQAIYLKNMNRDNDKLLYVNVASSRLDILRIKGKKLDYFNSFRYNTAEDFMYYLIFVVEQLGLNPESVELVMMGEVDKHSGITDLAMKYVRNIDFIKRNTDFRYSFVFDQIPGQYYFNLLNASLCE